MDNHFNLIDEAWIPVVDVGRVSLRQIFSNVEYRGLGGNPVQKIALMKLLLAIAQAAITPADIQEWKALGARGLAKCCLDYLTQWHDQFYLYGARPFLQMPAIKAAARQSFGAVLPEVSTGNTTVLSQIQVERPLEKADQAILLVSLMAFALAGKKTDNSITLTTGYKGKRNDKDKPSSSKPGPAVAHMGLLHSFYVGESLQETLWLNLLTTQQLEQMKIFPQGVGRAPWEQMPEGEDCPTARVLKQSLMGRLVPLCRFCLLDEKGVHYSEGLAHLGYKEGMADPTVAIDYTGRKPKALWVNPEKRPWRELTALLGFIEQNRAQGFESRQIRLGLERVRDVVDNFAIWSGGLRVSNNAGEQYISGNDDFVESMVWLHSDMLGQVWFAEFKAQMSALDMLAKNLYDRVLGFFKEQLRVSGFFKEQLMDGSKKAAQASLLFWQLCERDFQQLVDSCSPDEQGRKQQKQMRRRFAGYVQQVYDQACAKDTARQLDAWAKHRPNNSKYLKQEA